MRKTLVALATPPGRSALAIVRLTGADTYAIVERITRKSRSQLTPRLAVWTRFYNPQGVALDEGFILPFFAPKSFTGEDLCEFYLHGNPHLCRMVIETALAYGAKPADPGAFTRRAVLSGKMGLTEVESLAELMEAMTPQGAEAALRHLHGAVREFALRIRHEIMEILAHVEAGADFPEEGIEPETRDGIALRLKSLCSLLEGAAGAARRARIWISGATLTIAGAPNVGKSTLLNALLGKERALVSPSPGTTRDYLETFFEINGVPIRLIDTAGIRITTDPVELKGMELAREKIKAADLVLWVRSPVDPEDERLKEYFIGIPEERILVLWNKKDLAPPRGEGMAISAHNPLDIQLLRETIARTLSYPEEPPILATLRQEEHCRKALDALTRAASVFKSELPEEMALEELRLARREMELLLGTIDAEEVLERIFSRFCIGK